VTFSLPKIKIDLKERRFDDMETTNWNTTQRL
jgi:hypothetical protein